MDASTITWEGPLTIQEVAQQLTEALFGSLIPQVPPEKALRAEVLRVAIWEQSVLRQHQSITDARVSTQRILRRARSLWQPLSTILKAKDASRESHVEDELNRRALDDLAEQGDLLALSEGQWLPAPLRLVPISLDRYLLAGGLPSSFLPSTILQKFHLHDNFRQIEIDLMQKHPPFDGVAGGWQFQTQASWLGARPLTLNELLHSFRQTELLPQTTQYSAEVYIVSPDKPQGWRWLPLERVQKNGRYLLRSLAPWGYRFYTIGYVENHQVKQQSHTLESWDIRRLCYALDAEAHLPTRVTWDKQKGVLILDSELPVRERKYLAILGSLQTNSTGYYPRIWHISSHAETEVQSMLKALNIVIKYTVK